MHEERRAKEKQRDNKLMVIFQPEGQASGGNLRYRWARSSFLWTSEAVVRIFVSPMILEIATSCSLPKGGMESILYSCTR
jgi:hypothetical protein